MSAIGVFDSGVGGLTVVKELIRQLPHEDIIYFGDTARVPYGIKSKETVIRFSIENILFLLKREVKLICVACNTVSSFALPEIRNHFSKGTIKSRAYEVKIKQLDPKVKVTALACPLFVPFAEEGWFKGDVVLTVAKQYLKPLKRAGVDTLILGCTHYPLLKPVIKEVMGENVILIDSAKQVAMEVNKILTNENLLNKKGRGRHEFFVSDNPEWFQNLARRFLGKPIKNVRKVNNV
ncbi:MAG: glutamate racemase [Candidatus Omnitrophica bacterium]|nr:glutamate racemase [Candidatus Omnitrophota bacterium]